MAREREKATLDLEVGRVNEARFGWVKGRAWLKKDVFAAIT